MQFLTHRGGAFPRGESMDTQLTPAILAGLVGGQMEIQGGLGDYLYRGEIEALRVEGTDFVCEFKWLAMQEKDKWVKVNFPPYQVSLEFYSVLNIGPSGGEVGGGNRWLLNSAIMNETTTIFPPDGSKLDPAKVEGLVLTPA